MNVWSSMHPVVLGMAAMMVAGSVGAAAETRPADAAQHPPASGGAEASMLPATPGGFLAAAQDAGFAAVAVVTTLPHAGQKATPAELGIAWEDRLYAPPECRIYAYDHRGTGDPLAARHATLPLREETSVADLQAGDRILVTVGQDAVRAHAARNAKAGEQVAAVPAGGERTSWSQSAEWIPWSQSRHAALEAVLAPGWRAGCCPWCHRGAEPRHGWCACRDGCGGADGCDQNRKNRGKCVTCERTVGPATPGVTFRLWALDPGLAGEGAPRDECRITAGADSLPLWVEVHNEKGETPEFQTPGGRATFDSCNTLFYLVEGPGVSGSTPAFHVLGARAKLRVFSALEKGSATGQVKLVAGKLFGETIVSTPPGEGTKHVQPVIGKLFVTPGTYTVRAVAGRLVSNAVTVIVEADKR